MEEQLEEFRVDLSLYKAGKDTAIIDVKDIVKGHFEAQQDMKDALLKSAKSQSSLEAKMKQWEDCVDSHLKIVEASQISIEKQQNKLEGICEELIRKLADVTAPLTGEGRSASRPVLSQFVFVSGNEH